MLNESTDTTQDRENHLRIMQYNVNRRKEVIESILNDESTKEYSLLLLQEQYRQRITNTPPLHQSWTLLEPPSIPQASNPPRSAIYINNKLLPPSAFEQIPIPHNDITAISIAPRNPHEKPTLIVNIYNSREEPLIESLRTYLSNFARIQDYNNILVAGDFNLHHPLWNPQGYTGHESQADSLVDIMIEANLRPLLPSGTITFPTNNEQGGTAIDLVWGNENVEHLIIKCHTIEAAKDHASDHLPIEIIIDLEPKLLSPTSLAFNYAKTNWEVLRYVLHTTLPPPIDPNNCTVADLDRYAEDLTGKMKNAITMSTPRKKPCPHSKRWWNSELSNLRRYTNNARNRYRRSRDEVDGDEWREHRRIYKEEIRKAKNKKWMQFVEEADERTIYTVKKYIDKPPSPHYIPTINNATSNEAKAHEFRKAFFPPPPPANIDDIATALYPVPAPCNETITERQIQEVLNKISPKKAPGPDEISNLVLTIIPSGND